MQPIQPNCTEQLSADDIAFIAGVLAEPGRAAALGELLTDALSRDAVLENEALFRAIVESPRLLRISPQLYFYVLARRALAGFDRALVKYVSGVLVSFLHSHRLRALPARPELGSEYVTDMLQALAGATGETAFYIRVHVGNYTLFVSGIFADYLRHRAATRGAPDISFYEEVGRSSYRLAAAHRLARRQSLADLYHRMAEQFPNVRQGLNRLAEQLIFLEPARSPAP